MNKNNKEEKELLPLKNRKRHLSKLIKKILLALELGTASLLGYNIYKKIDQKDIKEIEEVSKDDKLLDQYNLKQEDIKKYLECEKKFKTINKMSDNEVHELLHETSKSIINIHKEKILNMFKNMSDKEKAKLAKEFEKTTDPDKIKKIYNIKNKEDIEIDLGVYSGENHITIFNKNGKVLCRYTEQTNDNEKTEFTKACNAVGKIQYYDKNFYENYDEEIKKALEDSFDKTNKIIRKEYVLEDGKIKAVEPEKEAFIDRLKIDLGNGYTAVINDKKENNNETKDIKNIDETKQEL